MDKNNYCIKKIEPCADYPGVTIEGNCSRLNLEHLYNKACIISQKIVFLKEASILICKVNDSDLYFYGEGRFIFSKITSEAEGTAILIDLLNNL